MYIEKDLPFGHFYECSMKHNKPKIPNLYVPLGPDHVQMDCRLKVNCRKKFGLV